MRLKGFPHFKFCSGKKLCCQWNKICCAFENVCSQYCARSLLKLLVRLMPSVARNLVMLHCTMDNCISCSVIVLFTRCETCIMSLGEGLLQTLLLLTAQGYAVLCPLTQPQDNNSTSYFIHFHVLLSCSHFLLICLELGCL